MPKNPENIVFTFLQGAIAPSSSPFAQPLNGCEYLGDLGGRGDNVEVRRLRGGVPLRREGRTGGG